MRPRKALVLLSLSAALGVLPYMRADAIVCCDPWGVPGATAFIQAGAAVVSTLSGSVASVSQYVTVSMQQTWAAGFGKAMEHVNKQTAAQRMFGQGRVQATSDLYMNGARASAMENGIEPAMLDETVTNAALMSEQIGQERENRRKEDVALSNDLRSADIAPEDPVRRHAAYCDPHAYAAGLCSSLPSSSMQSADLMVSTITNPGDGQYETMSDEEVAAGRAFIRNVVAPVPLRSLSASDPQSAQYEAMLLADQAALSIAGHSLNSVMGHRMRKRSGQ